MPNIAKNAKKLSKNCQNSPKMPKIAQNCPKLSKLKGYHSNYIFHTVHSLSYFQQPSSGSSSSTNGDEVVYTQKFLFECLKEERELERISCAESQTAMERLEASFLGSKCGTHNTKIGVFRHANVM